MASTITGRIGGVMHGKSVDISIADTHPTIVSALMTAVTYYYYLVTARRRNSGSSSGGRPSP